MRQREVSGNAGVEGIEAARRGARGGEERCHLALANLHARAHAREVGLNELFGRVVRAADGEELESERMAIALAHSVCAATPAGGVEQRVGDCRVLAEHRSRAVRVRGGNRLTRRLAVAVNSDRDDALAIDRERERAAHASVVEGWARDVEDDPVRLQHRVVDHAQQRIAGDERGHRGGDSGEIELATGEPREFRCGLVDDRDDHAPKPGRSAHGRPGSHRCARAPSAVLQRAGRSGKGRCQPGCTAKLSARIEARGTRARRCAGTIGSSQRSSGKRGCGVSKRSVTVESFSTVTLVSADRSEARGNPVAGSRAASSVKATSRAVVGTPSSQRSAGDEIEGERTSIRREVPGAREVRLWQQVLRRVARASRRERSAAPAGRADGSSRADWRSRDRRRTRSPPCRSRAAHARTRRWWRARARPSPRAPLAPVRTTRSRMG